MDFRDQADLDASQVEDAGGGGGFSGFSGFPGGVVVGGGGIVGLIVLVLVFVLNNVSAEPGQGRPPADLSARCQKGKDADQS